MWIAYKPFTVDHIRWARLTNPRNVLTQVAKHRLTDQSGWLNWELIKCFNWKSHCSRTVILKQTFQRNTSLGASSSTTRNNCFWLAVQSIPTWSDSLPSYPGHTCRLNITFAKKCNHRERMTLCLMDVNVMTNICSFPWWVLIQTTGANERLYKLFAYRRF